VENMTHMVAVVVCRGVGSRTAGGVIGTDQPLFVQNSRYQQGKSSL